MRIIIDITYSWMHSTVFNEIYPNKRKKEENPREGHQLTATESKPNREAVQFLIDLYGRQ